MRDRTPVYPASLKLAIPSSSRPKQSATAFPDTGSTVHRHLFSPHLAILSVGGRHGVHYDAGVTYWKEGDTWISQLLLMTCAHLSALCWDTCSSWRSTESATGGVVA